MKAKVMSGFFPVDKIWMGHWTAEGTWQVDHEGKEGQENIALDNTDTSNAKEYIIRVETNDRPNGKPRWPKKDINAQTTDINVAQIAAGDHCRLTEVTGVNPPKKRWKVEVDKTYFNFHLIVTVAEGISAHKHKIPGDEDATVTIGDDHPPDV